MKTPVGIFIICHHVHVHMLSLNQSRLKTLFKALYSVNKILETMQHLLLLIFLPLNWGFDQFGLCMDVTCQDGYYTEVVLQQIDTCPTNMTEIKKMQKKSEAVYEFDEELEKYVVKRYAKKKQAKEICKDIDEIGKVLKKGLVSNSPK